MAWCADSSLQISDGKGCCVLVSELYGVCVSLMIVNQPQVFFEASASSKAWTEFITPMCVGLTGSWFVCVWSSQQLWRVVYGYAGWTEGRTHHFGHSESRYLVWRWPEQEVVLWSSETTCAEAFSLSAWSTGEIEPWDAHMTEQLIRSATEFVLSDRAALSFWFSGFAGSRWSQFLKPDFFHEELLELKALWWRTRHSSGRVKATTAPWFPFLRICTAGVVANGHGYNSYFMAPSLCSCIGFLGLGCSEGLGLAL